MLTLHVFNVNNQVWNATRIDERTTKAFIGIRFAHWDSEFRKPEISHKNSHGKNNK